MTASRGFTLIELMIVIIIIGLLFGFALPAYQDSMLRAHRADAQGSLLDISAREERFMAQNNTYTTDIAGATGLNLGSAVSPAGYYNLSIAACGAGTIATCYVITAAATGGQTNDTDCVFIAFDSFDVKSGTTGNCW
jgi:type IV pilus assembly protein PilE